MPILSYSFFYLSLCFLHPPCSIIIFHTHTYTHTLSLSLSRQSALLTVLSFITFQLTISSVSSRQTVKILIHILTSNSLNVSLISRTFQVSPFYFIHATVFFLPLHFFELSFAILRCCHSVTTVCVFG